MQLYNTVLAKEEAVEILQAATTLIKLKKWTKLIRRHPQDAPDGSVFTEEEVEAILGGNAHKLFGL